jgi:hypothetical protein
MWPVNERQIRGQLQSLLAVAIAASATLCCAQLRAQEAAFSTHGSLNETSLRILPWTMPNAPRRSLLDLLSERDRRHGESAWPQVLETPPGIGLFDTTSSRLADTPSINRKPILGSLSLPFGTMSVVSEKVDAQGHFAGLDFFRFDNHSLGIDAHLSGSTFKISHRWGAKAGDRPFADREKVKVPMPQ